MRNPKFLGVFSKVKDQKSRSRKQLNFVWELDKNNCAIQELNEALVPVARPQVISSSKLKTGYRLEAAILAAPITTPDFRHLQAPKKEATELTDAALLELERARKAKQVEADLRDNFAKAIRALNRPKDRKGALAALDHIAHTKEGIVPVHKHMFRDFGVTLRKKSLPELALVCTQRVLELAPQDDHAHFNMARIFFVLNMPNEAIAHLQRAIQLDSREKVYKTFLQYIMDHN